MHKLCSLCIVLGASTAAMVDDVGKMLQVSPVEDGATVRVVGDTHGQLHDVLHM